ncbi:MAG: hypothetical protein NTX04_01415 [Verrucomicrobia bacterium]|nr:hypothetical protein [Verrucomicrobiota bacterium]
MSAEKDRLAQQIIEASVFPEIWPEVLQEVANQAGALGASLFTSDARSMFRWTSSESIRGLMEI